MTIPNRELSQFASFLSINDTNRNIGITTGSTPYVGIGTTNPQEKLHIQGNVKASGVVSASQFYGDGSTLSNVVGVISGTFIVTASGIYTGSNLGIGTSTLTEKLNVGGSVGITSNLTAYRLSSNAPSGIPPFSVQSNTLVNNLNTDFFRGRIPPTGNFVGDVDSQSLSNKTLVNPTISTIVNGTATLTVPTTSGTLIHSNAVGILTSGVYGNASISNIHISNSAAISYSKLNLLNSIVNSDISVGAGITYGKLNILNSIKSSDIDENNPILNDKLKNSTISGISLGSNLNNLVKGSYINGENYNGSTETTWDINANTSNVFSSIVARNSTGDIDVSKLKSTEIEITSGSPTIKLIDNNISADDFWIVTNANTFYVLSDLDDNNTVDSIVLSLSNPLSKGYLYGSEIITSSTDQTLTGKKIFNGPATEFINTNNPAAFFERNNNGNLITFRRGNVTVGSIEIDSTSSVAYRTSSDYRLKENLRPIENSTDKVLSLNPVTCNFIEEPDKNVDVFIAHEIQQVVPNSASGKKDEVDEEGNPIYQGVDYSKVTPLLTAALQETIKENEKLKAELELIKTALLQAGLL